MYYNWIEEHEITKLKQIFASNQEKRTQKQAQKDMNEMERHKMDYLIFPAMRMRKRHLFFAPVVTTTYRIKKQQKVT